MATRFYDCHTHLFPADRMGSLMRWIHSAVLDFRVPVDITADEAVADLRAAGAVRWANLVFPIGPDEAPGLHEWSRELADRVPEITPFGGVHADEADPLAVVQEAVEDFGMAGFKFHPMVQGFDPWDNRLRSVLAYFDAAGLPIVVHTGYDHQYEHAFDRIGLEAMLETHPGMPVVLAHMCFPDIGWGFSLAEAHPQVWLDLTNVPGSLQNMDNPGKLMAELRIGLSQHRSRCLMGTDYPTGMGNLDEILTQYRSLEIEEALLVESTKAFFDEYGGSRT